MHGVVLDEMRQFVADQYGYRAWIDTLKRSGRPPTYHYELDQVYPDKELATLASSASEVTRTPLPALLEAFGEAMVPDMFKMYSYLSDPSWTYADFLLNMEGLLVQALQVHTPGAAQAKVHVRRLSDQTLEVEYDSPLHACSAVQGVMKGAAHEYAASATITQTRCVLRGDPACVFSVAIEAGRLTPDVA